MKLIPVSPDVYTKSGVCKPSSFLQSPFWANFKACQGWQPLGFLVGDVEPVYLSVLVRSFSRFASIAYVPLGPDIPVIESAERSALLESLSRALAPELPRNTLFIRFDPPWGTKTFLAAGMADKDDEQSVRTVSDIPEIPGHPVFKAPADIQPPDTVILDLSLSEDDILSGMKQKWRYNIRLAEKKGVTVRFLENGNAVGEGINTFYTLYQETAKRDGIAIHTREYYERLFMMAEEAYAREEGISIRLYLAEYEGTVLAAIITLFRGAGAVYLYGASSNEKRNLMPAYCLQWSAIRDAKTAGCNEYDFYGIPPTDDPSHPMHGLYRFKTGFGGSIVHRVGSLDLPLRSVAYTLYRIAEKARIIWFKKILKRFKR